MLDSLGLDRVHVYGTSMGGRIAQMLAIKHAHRVDRLVLACTTPGGEHALERSHEVRVALSDADQSRRTAALVRLFYTDAWGADASRSNLLGDPSMTARSRSRHLRLSARHDAWHLLPAIGAPTLVLHGEDDLLAPIENAHVLAARIPDCRVKITAGGRHGFFDEFAGTVQGEVSNFLST